MQYVTSPVSGTKSLSTLASSQALKTEDSEFTMVFSEKEIEGTQGNLAKPSKNSKSKERKLSTEDAPMLPPRALQGAILRPCAKFASKSSLFSNAKLTTAPQALKPMTILGFLQQSVKDQKQGNTKKRVEKAGLKSLEALSLTASFGKADSSIPSFTLG